jgi:DNA-binding transcriptional LysR family regulator
LEQAHHLVITLEQVHSIAGSYHTELKGRIRITSPIHIGQYYLQPVISQFMKRYPQVEVTLMADDKRSNIISDHFDLAFRLGRLDDSSLIAKKVADIRPVILASDDFIALHGEPKTPEELMNLPSVIYSNGNITVDTVNLNDRPGSKEFKSYKMKGNYKVNDVSTLIGAVADGLGYAVVASSNLARPIEEMNLKPLLTDYAISNNGLALYALYPHRKQTALVTEFIKAVQQHVGDTPLWEKHIPNFDRLYQA